MDPRGMGRSLQQGPTLASWIVADKQLYSDHYFQTAIDLWFCVLDTQRPSRKGFYLLNFKGSRQDGLTGLKGRIVRSVALSKTVSAMEAALLRLKGNAEGARVQTAYIP